MPIIAKLMETHVSRHLRGLLEDNGMNDPFQSAYRPYHSTETATVKIFSDICLSLSRSRCALPTNNNKFFIADNCPYTHIKYKHIYINNAFHWN